MSTTLRAALRWTLLIVSLAVLCGLILLITRPSLYAAHARRTPMVAAAWVTFGVSAYLVRKVAIRPAVGLIIAAGIALQAIAFTAPVSHSSDIYRYMWDGQVQAAGIDPYMYPPSAAALAPLRNDYIWGPYTTRHPVGYGLQYCVTRLDSPQGPAYDRARGCSRINRTNSPTIYPPVAEAWFTAVYLVAGDGTSTPMQVAMALCAILVTLVLVIGLRKLGRDPRLAVLWAWCPTAVLEIGNDGHSDVLGVLLTVIALMVLTLGQTRKRLVLGGVLLGLALATKLTPVFTFPGVLRRGWQYILAAAATATVIVYVPHLIAAGRHVIGFFPMYLQQQGYSSGSGYQVIALVAHGKLASAVAFLLMGIVALAILRYCDPTQPWRGGIYMMAAALVIGTPQFEWYSMLLVMLVALDGRWEWLALCAGAYLANDATFTVSRSVVLAHPRVLGYGGGLVIALAITWVRYLHARRSGAPAAVPASPRPVAGSVLAATISARHPAQGPASLPGGYRDGNN